MSDDRIEVEATVIHRTDAGVLLESHTTGRQAWFPLSLLEEIGEDEWLMPEGLATDREFV